MTTKISKGEAPGKPPDASAQYLPATLPTHTDKRLLVAVSPLLRIGADTASLRLSIRSSDNRGE